MKNSFVFEINMWRWLLGTPLAAAAIIAVFIFSDRFVLPFVIALIAIYILIAEVYIPHYYSAFDFSVFGRAVVVTKGVIIKSQTIIPLEGALVFERVWVFPFCIFGACLFILRSRGVIVTLPLMKTEKVNKIIEDTENAQT